MWSLLGPFFATAVNTGFSGDSKALTSALSSMKKMADVLHGRESEEREEEFKLPQQERNEVFSSHPLFRANVPHLLHE